MTTDEIVAYYVNLLIAQYINRTKAAGTIDLLTREVIADQIITLVKEGFAIPTAVGKQLDYMGEYRGIKRQITGLNLNKIYMSMPAHADSFTGLKGVAEDSLGAGVSWFFARVQDINYPLYTLSDSDFRQLILLKALLSGCGYGLGELDLIIKQIFGNYVTMIDNFDMTVTFNDAPADPNILFTLADQAHALPRPAGVGYNVTHV